jgi:DnaA family protein
MCKNAVSQQESSFYDVRMAQQLILDILPPPNPAFDNMVPGQNGAAIEAARHLGRGKTLYVWGPDGSGRSHLLQACAREHPAGTYVSASQALPLLPALLDHDEPQAALIAIDDVHRLSDAALAAVFSLYNRWREQAASPEAFSLIVAGDRAPLQMPLREDLRTRLGWGLVYRLWPLSDQEKSDALAAFAARSGMPLSGEVIRWLLTHGSRDIGSLFAWVDALDRYALSQHRALTLPLLRSMLTHNDKITDETDPPSAI